MFHRYNRICRLERGGLGQYVVQDNGIGELREEFGYRCTLGELSLFDELESSDLAMKIISDLSIYS